MRFGAGCASYVQRNHGNEEVPCVRNRSVPRSPRPRGRPGNPAAHAGATARPRRTAPMSSNVQNNPCRRGQRSVRAARGRHAARPAAGRQPPVAPRAREERASDSRNNPMQSRHRTVGKISRNDPMQSGAGGARKFRGMTPCSRPRDALRKFCGLTPCSRSRDAARKFCGMTPCSPLAAPPRRNPRNNPMQSDSRNNPMQSVEGRAAAIPAGHAVWLDWTVSSGASVTGASARPPASGGQRARPNGRMVKSLREKPDLRDSSRILITEYCMSTPVARLSMS
jgi:hypothetical protein